MKKSTLFLAIILTLSITAIILSSCTSNTAPLTPVTVTSTVTETLSSSQTPVTVTTTQTVTVTATQTEGPALLPQIANQNSSRFLVGRGVTGYTNVVNVDGSVSQSPIYEDSFLDLNLLGFYSQKDATFVSKIPTITNRDQWIVKFKIPAVNLPVIVNWGYVTKSGKPDSTFTFSIWDSDMFKSLYSTKPDTLISGKGSTNDLYVSADGVHVQNINKTYEFTAFIHTQNSEDILGWWMKSGATVTK